MAKDPTFSIIIPTYHDSETLQICLYCIGNQSVASDYYEVIVINNHPDNNLSTLKQPPNCKIIDEPTPGSYAARNAGVLASKGKILAFTDADCQPDKDWLLNAMNLFSKSPDITRIAGHINIIYPDSGRNLAQNYEAAFFFNQKGFVHQHGAGATANMFAYRSAFKEIGLFHAKTFSGGDLEWGKRANAAGLKIAFCPEAIVHHPSRDSLADIASKTKRIAGGQYILKSGRQPLLWWITRLTPPIYAFYTVFSQKDTQLLDRLKIYLFHYYLRLVTFRTWLTLKLKISKPHRA